MEITDETTAEEVYIKFMKSAGRLELTIGDYCLPIHRASMDNHEKLKDFCMPFIEDSLKRLRRAANEG